MSSTLGHPKDVVQSVPQHHSRSGREFGLLSYLGRPQTAPLRIKEWARAKRDMACPHVRRWPPAWQMVIGREWTTEEEVRGWREMVEAVASEAVS